MISNLIKKIQSLFLFEDGQGIRKEQRLLLSSWLAKFVRNHFDQVNEIPEKTPIQSISNIIVKYLLT